MGSRISPLLSTISWGCFFGIASGVGLLAVLYNLNRRHSGEDSVVQVVATITAAYLSFFTSEILAKCSGIIAVLFCGVVTKVSTTFADVKTTMISTF